MYTKRAGVVSQGASKCAVHVSEFLKKSCEKISEMTLVTTATSSLETRVHCFKSQSEASDILINFKRISKEHVARRYQEICDSMRNARKR